MPEIRLDQFSSFCSLGPRPFLMTGFLRQWMTSHFSAETQIEHPELRSLVWQKNITTEILIESITKWKPELTGKRPAIMIKRNDWQVVRWGIGNRMLGDDGSDLGYEHFAVGLVGSHTFFCISSEAQVAEVLGCEVYRELMRFSPVIQRALDLKRLELSGIGALFEIEEELEHYAVPITIMYGLEDKWVLLPHAPHIKTIKLSALIE